MEKKNLLPLLNTRRKTNFEAEMPGLLGSKLKGIKGLVLKEETDSNSKIYNVKTDNLCSTRSSRPKTRIEVVIEYLYEILRKFEEYNNSEFVFKTECVIKEIKSNKMYKYEQQLDPMQNKLLNLYSPDFYKEEKDENEDNYDNEEDNSNANNSKAKNICISENDQEEDAEDVEADGKTAQSDCVDNIFNDLSLKADDDDEALVQLEKPKETSLSNYVFNEDVINSNTDDQDNEENTQLDNEKNIKLINSNTEQELINDKKQIKMNKINSYINSQYNNNTNTNYNSNSNRNSNRNNNNNNNVYSTTNSKLKELKFEKRKSNLNIKKFYRTQSISIDKLIKPLDYTKFGVYFDVFAYAEEIGRIFLLKQVTLAALSYKEVYSFLKSGNLENYIEELRLGYTSESNSYYHNVSN